MSRHVIHKLAKAELSLDICVLSCVLLKGCFLDWAAS